MSSMMSSVNVLNVFFQVLQKLGKADETKDEQFEQVVVNFRRQETEGSRLQREMKSYMSAIKGMQQASINLTKSLHEVYEPDWHGKDDVMSIGKDCDALWEDFHNKLVDSTLLNLDEYLQFFPDLKTRVSKRSRKLIDYDSARHHMETLQVSGMKNDRKMIKAEEELKKAQKVFDELNVGLQDELPTLWDSRVGFYIGTFKSVTSLEAKFHREISLVCRQLYEVMTKLAEQHSDKMFTIQGAPSDSGPLRLERTPSPPEDESPLESPDVSSNHMLRPVSPGPPRPKSPTQFKKGPPVPPPPPKATPTKEVAEEQIIDLFGGEFFAAPSASQPNERPGESLLDLDFDAFQSDESVSPIPQTDVPWDMWTANSQTAQPSADAGFVADWSADFGSMSTNGDTWTAEAPVLPAEGPVDTQGGAQADWFPGGDIALSPQDSEVTTAETRSALTPSSSCSWDRDRDRDWAAKFRGHKREVVSPDGSGSEYETAEEWETRREVVVRGGCFAETQGEGAFDLDPFAETQGEGAFDSDPFAETQGEGAFDVSPFNKTLSGTKGNGFECDPFGEKSWAGGVMVTGHRRGWDSNSSARSFHTPSSGIGGPAPLSTCGAPEGNKDVNVIRIHKEPENSDMSEDEAANRRFEKLYQELEREKDEESPAPELHAAFDEKNEDAESTEAAEETSAATTQELDEPPTVTAGEQHATPPAGEAEEPALPCAKNVPEHVQSPRDEKPASIDESPASETVDSVQENMSIPSVVIEPASSNEGDDDRDADIISPTVTSDHHDNVQHMSPSDFLYKVETLHDFEAANPDELELKRGDVVLVVPTASVEDQDAGWLTGIKESEWLTVGAAAHKGLFPENFTQRLE
uniref:amphiphysin-like n=1 Tax=Solea senegalensis TaxID=28829 RepID=UPI001CD8D02E|nr:amphiphysin-like [Solea senegalensis]